MDAGLAAELGAMVAEDQRVRTRNGPPPAGGYRLSTAAVMESSRVDVRNTDRLREIVSAHGWPGFDLVGEQGEKDAWLLAQHADRQLGFQREALALLTQAVADGDATPSHLAYLTDRVRMNEGREQLYGTQMTSEVGGRPTPWPIEDPAHVDERRAAVGLGPLDEYVARFQPQAPAE
jgi:hypothetical protein